MSLLSEAPPWPEDGSEPPARFEYFTVAAIGADPLTNIAPALNRYGLAGWELVALDGRTLVFKRPYPAAATEAARPQLRRG